MRDLSVSLGNSLFPKNDGASQVRLVARTLLMGLEDRGATEDAQLRAAPTTKRHLI